MPPQTQPTHDLEIIAEVGKSLLGAVDLPEQLTLTLDHASRAINADRGSIMLLDKNTNELIIEVSRGLPPLAAHTHTPLGAGIAGWVAMNKEAVVLNGDFNDPRFSGTDPSIASAISLPLVVRGEVLGVLNLVRRQSPEMFTDRDLSLAGSLADLAALAIEKARLHNALKEREERVSDLLAAAIGAQEKERRRIAGDIHDGFLQDLSALFLQAETAKMQLARGKYETVGETLTQMQEMLREEVANVRNYIFEVRPPSLDEVGLAPTLKGMVERTSDEQSLKGIFVDHSGDERMREALETILYRTAQEGLRNIAKHAKAKSFTLLLEKTETELVLSVKDDGVGIGATVMPMRGRHYGIETMRERVELAGGTLSVTEVHPHGTEVKAVIPLSESPLT
ncbi:MAG: GAF domain-containing protein [Actinomycetota bacterium]|nr:GAF domain-containing sensor histidine kinase [Actinomycetota bacterium]